MAEMNRAQIVYSDAEPDLVVAQMPFIHHSPLMPSKAELMAGEVLCYGYGSTVPQHTMYFQDDKIMFDSDVLFAARPSCEHGTLVYLIVVAYQTGVHTLSYNGMDIPIDIPEVGIYCQPYDVGDKNAKTVLEIVWESATEEDASSVGKKFLLYRMFHPIIARALCATGQTAPDSVLVSADGYVLTDKNGVYLIPKEVGSDATLVQFIVTGDETFSFSSANKAVYFMNEAVALKTREQIVNPTCTHFTYGAGNVLAEMNDGEFIFNITVADGLTTGNVSFKNSEVFTSKANAVAWFKEQLANGTPVTITYYIKEVE